MAAKPRFAGSFLLFWPALLLCGAAVAQTTGRIEGVTRGESAAALPGVTVEVTGPRLQGVRNTVTDSAGRYRFPELPPGPYRVRATLTTFLPEEKSVTLSLDEALTLDFEIKLAVSESVNVAGEVGLVDVSSTTTGTTYTDKVVAKLPVARNYADIIHSNPGVNTDKGGTQGRSLKLTVYGTTSAENQWIIDGINTTNVLTGVQGKALNTEFVEEVEVKTGGYQAEYGRALGGIINVITKSGGNAFHGDAFAYYDSEATRARQGSTNVTSTSAKITPDRRWDYGVDVGGYFVKDRLWFFAAYDRVETPGTASRYQDLKDRFGVVVVPSSFQVPRDQTDQLWSGKLTWNIAAGSTLVATAFSDPTEISGAAQVGTSSARVGGQIQSPDPGTWESRREIGGTDYGLRFSQLLGSSGVVDLQGSRHQDRFELFPPSAAEAVRLEDRQCNGGTPLKACNSRAIEPNSVSGGLGRIDGSTQRNSSRRDQFRADATFYLGDHEIKTGGDYQDGRTTSVSSFTGGQLVTRANEFGQPYYVHNFFVKSTTDVTPGDGAIGARAIDEGAYLQDTWRIAPGWTINAGLRWEQADLRNYLEQTVVETTHEWQPRLGVVWDPTRQGRMKIYASAGRFYYSLPTNLSVFAYGASAEVKTYNFDPIDRIQSPSVFGHEQTDVFAVGAGEPVDSGLKGIYQDELIIGVERLLDPTFSVGMKGTYRRLGRWIEDRCDLDPDAPPNNGSNCAIINPGSGGAYARGDFYACSGLDSPYNECGYGAPATPPARRIYRGIEILARKTIRQRLWLQASYAYSSLRGNIDGAVNEIFSPGQTDPGTNSDFNFPAFWHDSYGRLFLDRPHQARLDASYAAPFGLLVGLAAYVQSGSPLNKKGYFSEAYAGTPVQLVPRGQAGRMPTLWEANLTVGYPIPVGPATVTLQAYLYNVFNNQIPTDQVEGYIRSRPPGYPGTLYDPDAPPSCTCINSIYGKIAARQDPRLFRAAVRVSF